jgi:hypothetical protein
MYYKDVNTPYENIGNMITGFPKYFKVFSNGFVLIDTYDQIRNTYHREVDVSELTPIEKSEWDTVNSLVETAYEKRRELFFYG